MKKQILIFIAVAVAASATGQQWCVDTISGSDKYVYYMYGDWPTSIYAGDTIDVTLLVDNITSIRTEVAQQYVSREPVKVYGIACGLAIGMDTAYYIARGRDEVDSYKSMLEWIKNQRQCSQFYGPIRSEFARLYKPETNSSMTVLAQKAYHPSMDSVDVRMVFNEVERKYSTTYTEDYVRCKVFVPIIEVFFNDPVTVCDTFFVGSTECTEKGYWPVGVPAITKPRNSGNEICHNALAYKQRGDDDAWIKNPNSNMHMILFPILGRDTTHTNQHTSQQGQDNSAIGEGAAGRYVTVSPNPTTGIATVAAGCGMSLIELYDPAGQLLRTIEPNGLTATIDVAGLASGLYLLKIHTALGIATKKLMVL